MWVFLSIASLLIRAIVGNLEIGNNGIPERVQFADGNNYAGNQIKLFAAGVPKVGNREAFATEKSAEQNNLSTGPTGGGRSKGDGNPENAQTSRNVQYNRDTGGNIKAISKRSETASAGSWLYLPLKGKVSSIDGFQDSSQEKKSPSFNPWGGKRFTLYRSSPSIRRPIRVPFNSWGGKRGNEYLEQTIDPQAKRSKLAQDRDGQRVFYDGYGVKRVAEAGKIGWKVPFNSWGGKRSQEVVDPDRKQFTLLMEKGNDFNDENDLDDVKDELSNGGSIRNGIGGKRAQVKSKQRTAFNSWGGKRNRFDYQTLSHSKNETSDDYTAEEEIDDNGWLISAPDKRAERGGLPRKASFNPWGGKRSSEAYALRLDDDYSDLPRDSGKGRQVFFPWGG